MRFMGGSSLEGLSQEHGCVYGSHLIGKVMRLGIIGEDKAVEKGLVVYAAKVMILYYETSNGFVLFQKSRQYLE